MVAKNVADMTRDELKDLVRELMQEVFSEWEENQPDSDEGLELSTWVVKRLRQYERGKTPVKTAEQVERELGLNE
ncbi:MAG: hypothetical protein JW910_21130 [Anaerolineae bacterium]|nr:hypothetical protein [Anaerolineae bacterium]